MKMNNRHAALVLFICAFSSGCVCTKQSPLVHVEGVGTWDGVSERTASRSALNASGAASDTFDLVLHMRFILNSQQLYDFRNWMDQAGQTGRPGIIAELKAIDPQASTLLGAIADFDTNGLADGWQERGGMDCQTLNGAASCLYYVDIFYRQGLQLNSGCSRDDIDAYLGMNFASVLNVTSSRGKCDNGLKFLKANVTETHARKVLNLDGTQPCHRTQD